MQAEPLWIFEYLLSLKKILSASSNVFQNENGKFWLCRELPKISWQNNPMPVLSDNKCLWKFKKPAQHNFDSEKLDLVREWLDFDLENQTAQFRLKKEKVNLAAADRELFQKIEAEIQSLENKVNNFPELFEENGLKQIQEQIEIKKLMLQEIIDCKLEKLAENPEILSAAQEVYQDWQKWANLEIENAKSRQIYDDIFDLYQKLESSGNTLEFVCGQGLITYRDGDTDIAHPLFITKLKLVFDLQANAFKVFPLTAITCLDYIALTDHPQIDKNNLWQLQQQLLDKPVNLFSPEERKKLFFQVKKLFKTTIRFNAAHNIGHIDNIEYTPNLVFHDLDVLFVRNKISRKWQEEYLNILAAAKTAKGLEIPATLRLLNNEDQVNFTPNDLGEDIYFPLYSNLEQRQIVEKIKQNPAVVVQGPPGTGKSHNIVNLVAHLVASGKKVLVTSQTTKALKVIDNMIARQFSELANFCVTIFGDDKQDLNKLEYILDNNLFKLDKLDAEYLAANIELAQARFKKLSKQAEITIEKIHKLSQEEFEKGCFVDKNLNQAELIDFILSKEQEYNWFIDEAAATKEFPYTNQQFSEYFKMCIPFTPEKLRILQQDLPEVSKTGEILKNIDLNSKINDLRKVLQVNKFANWVFANNLSEHYLSYRRLLSLSIEKLEEFQETYLKVFIEDISRNVWSVSFWREFIITVKDKLNQIAELQSRLEGYTLTGVEELDLDKLAQDLERIKAKLIDNDKIGLLLFRYLSNKDTKYIFETIEINGIRISNLQDVDVVLDYVVLAKTKQEFLEYWNQGKLGEQIAITSASQNNLDFVEAVIQKMQLAFAYKLEYWDKIKEVINFLNPDQHINIVNKQDLTLLQEALEYHHACEQLEQMQDTYQQTLAFLKAGINSSNAHQLWGMFLKAFLVQDEQTFKLLFEELVKIDSLRRNFKELSSIYQIVQTWMPALLEKLHSEKLRLDFIQRRPDWQKAYFWRQAKDFMQNHLQQDIRKLYADYLHYKDQELVVAAEIVTNKAWLQMLQAANKNNKLSLKVWVKNVLQCLRNKDELSNRYLENARQELPQCTQLMPVWIMPIAEVLDYIPASTQLFDVVIIDESSQCDIFALSVLLRAKQVVIVGDDKQISPEMIIADNARVNSLMNKYLQTPLLQTRFNVKNSLYDIAKQTYIESQLMLKEHFRCFPEIINFSNREFYSGSIKPLKLNKAINAINSCLVEDSISYSEIPTINMREAQLIVEKIAEFCQLEQYQGKSMGVISLAGNEQAEFIASLLRNTIGEYEILNRRIVCGDAYSFQGDERDIIFLSMVVMPDTDFRVLNKIKDEQMVNVAMTRAKEQLFLYHSVVSNNLERDCLRYKLINYCNHYRKLDTTGLCEVKVSEFKAIEKSKQEIKQYLLNLDYQVIEDYPIADDVCCDLLVMNKQGKTMAIDCSGFMRDYSEGINRKLSLQRVGWQYYHLLPSELFFKRKTVLEEILNSFG